MPLAVSVIIPVFRDTDRLRTCIEALQRQTLPADSFEVIVGNNEPEPWPEAPDWLPGNVRVIHEPKPGSYAARNSAVAQAAGSNLAFTDSDCVPDPEWLENGLARLAANPGQRITGPVTIFREARTEYYAYLFEFHTAFRQREAAALGRCVTANLFVSREVFDRVGGFDERLLSGGDYDWNGRAQEIGIPLFYDERVTVRHPARQTLREILRKKRRTSGSGLWLRDHSSLHLLLRMMKPPVRVLATFDRAPVRVRDRIPLILVTWLVQVVEHVETVRVRRGKQPNRS